MDSKTYRLITMKQADDLAETIADWLFLMRFTGLDKRNEEKIDRRHRLLLDLRRAPNVDYPGEDTTER